MDTKPTGEEKKGKRKRLKLHEIPLLEDIRYRGLFSYQSFQIIGWLCIWIGQIVFILNIASRLDPSLGEKLANPITIGVNVANMALPFLLIANFAIILGNPDGIISRVARHGAAMLGLAAVYLLFTQRYLIGGLAVLMKNTDDARIFVESALTEINQHGYIDFNIFVDLFLCSLFMFFLDYRPKRFFTGKRLILFRLMSLLPVAYEVGCLVLKALAIRGKLDMPSYAFAFLPVKPPMTFVVFILLALHIKNRERRFCRDGRTWEEYRQFLQTRRNSWHFSRFLAVVLFLAAVVDVAVLVLGTRIEIRSVSGGMTRVPTAMGIGFGDSIYLAFLAPITLLFSYNRIPKNQWISMMIPIAAIGLIILTYIEGAFQLLNSLTLPDLNLSLDASSLMETMP